MTKFRYAFLMLAAASIPVGCMSIPMAPNANTASVGNPMPLINLGSSNRNALTVKINYQDLATGFKTKSGAALTSAQVTFYAIDLVTHIVGNTAADNYGGASPLATLFLNGPAWTGSITGSIADAGTTGAFAFTNVPAGQYRFRVKASLQPSGPAAVPPGGQEANKPDLFFTSANGGWEVSDNFATVTNGQSLVSYSAGGNLNCTVALKDAVGDLVSSQITVTNGASIGGIGTIDQ